MILFTLVAACYAAGLAAAAPARPAFLTPMEWAVALCETGGNFKHRTRDYQGAWGFYRGSWDEFKPAGYPSDADDATPRQQATVMRRIRARYGWTGWGCVTHGGYRAWM